MKNLFVLCLCFALLSSCATIFNGSKARIVVADDKVTDPVDLTIDGAKYPDILLPAKVKVKRGFKESTIVAEAPGYDPATVRVDKKFNSTTLWNIIFGGIPGMAVDAATGAMMKPESKYYNLNMQPATPRNYVVDPTIVAGEASNMVSRDNPGQTALERTIIRWYFDSDPRGARIYWRGGLSIPPLANNTHATHLLTTPLAVNRAVYTLVSTSDNTPGLPVENKVSKRGYEDQVKRFNVRQAIDQQEISSFFELVEKPDAE